MRREIAAQLARWNAGGDDLAISGGACGADILFAEASLERGAQVLLLIALPDDAFLAKSVAFAGADWAARYHALRARCETRFQHETLGPPAAGEDVFGRNNLWRLDTAYALAPPDRVRALLVWDGKQAGDGPGGTADFARHVARRGGDMAVIDPAGLRL